MKTYNEKTSNDVSYRLESTSNTTESKFTNDDNFQICEKTLEEDNDFTEKANDNFNVDVLGNIINMASISFFFKQIIKLWILVQK